ncbi:hypothetical protein DYB25_004508 [Aphanomyces astaci]|uniref:AttH domain-containing protein n=1 Tax=Aphanomyces astaci TaxID=112090 RepID=A0A397DEA6_APHAT|nr:hypothetical protein DYB36_007472 [Aphanomyces astaci]RHY11299.1 hypothetical protein DYB25_004508 [Aphanomyces astaci]RHY55888.1 hypothetical protein DYB38_002548 [Aphanomyces astaci]RHY63754.1 hypothetical protein DYB30_003929 [Aphanomyces astaci]RHY65696.1 hypothetical protein DYB34_001507 [Aphanomyces astaci]
MSPKDTSRRSGRWTASATAAIGIVGAAIYLGVEPAPYAATTSEYFPAHAPATATAPAALWSGTTSSYTLGRWTEPITDVRFHFEHPRPSSTSIADAIIEYGRALPARIQTKKWHYTSINTRDHFIAIAVVSLQYLSPMFVYVVDKATMEKWEYGAMLPGSYGVKFAASSVDPATCTSVASVNLRMCFQDNAWRMSATSIPLTSSEDRSSVRPFSFELTMLPGEPLILSFPLANDIMRPSYVHKGAGYAVHGTYSFGSVDTTIATAVPALGTIDWTKSLALHRTEWNWVSSTFVADDGTAVGINLSRRVYDVDGASQENAIWLDGIVCVLGAVTFDVPEDGMTQAWRIRSVDGVGAVNLTFVPGGARQERLNVLNVLRSDFVQPYGRFTGKISCTGSDRISRTVDVQDAFGVVEDHFALW